MPYLKPYSIPWLSFVSQKARMDMDAGSDCKRVLESLLDDLDRFVEHNRKKQSREVSEDERKRRSERMKAMRASGVGGFYKTAPRPTKTEKEEVSDAEG